MPIYDTSTLGTTGNQIVFNDDTSNPYFRVVKRLPTKRELREFDIDIPETLGVADFQTLIGRTHFVIEGVMYPDDETSFHQGRERLRKIASPSIEQADTTSDQGYVPYKWNENVPKQLMVKVLYCDMQETTRQGLKQPFRLFCKVKYPVITAQSSTTVNVGDGTIPTPVGSSGLPFKLPVLLGKSTTTASGSGTNTGDLPSYPTITIYGPVNRPKITNSTTGEYLELTTNLATSSDTIIAQYDQDTVSITQAGVSVFNQITTGSTLFKISPGLNSFIFSASSVGTGARVVITFNAAWPLS